MRILSSVHAYTILGWPYSPRALSALHGLGLIPYHSWPSKTILSCADARTYLSAIIAFNQLFWFPVNDCRRFRYKTYKTLCLHWDTWIFLRCLNNSLWWYILEPNQYSVYGDSYRPMGLNDHLSTLYMNFLAKIFLINKTSWVKEIRYVYMVCLCSLSQICQTLKRCNNLDFSVHNQYYLFFS